MSAEEPNTTVEPETASDAEPETATSDVDMGEPQEWKKYQTYAVKVDPDQDDKSTEIKLCSFARPHMRAFHVSWIGFFLAFCIWFSIAPLLPQVRTSLGISNQDIWTSSITSVAGTIIMRFVLGPFCDKYGARVLFAAVLCLCSIPTGLIGLVNTSTGLAITRLFIGVVGSTFVMCQYWSSRMFAKEVVGTANALTAGWGNLGGGVTQLITGSILFPLFKIIYGGDANKAWRTVCVVPAVVTFAWGIIMYKISDDAPKGNYTELKKHGNMPEVSAAASFRIGALNVNTWLLFLQYAGCLGVELTMYNATALYYTDRFGQSTVSAAAIASIFGWMNVFSRGLGGYTSDLVNKRWGMRGRLSVQFTFLACEAALLFGFANCGTLGGSIAIMIFFSLFLQAASGSSFAIVPYINPPATGAIAGVVGAGGNCGAVGFGLVFRQMSYYYAFHIMGSVVVVAAISVAFVHIKGYAGLLWGKDLAINKETGTLVVPEKDAEATDGMNP